MKKSICFVHYGIGWRDGVNTVIKNLASYLKKERSFLRISFIAGEIKPFLRGTEYFCLPELKPPRKRLKKKEIAKQAEIIARKLANLTKDFDRVIIENPFLGTYHLAAMMGFSLYSRKYKPLGTKVFFRIHDFYSDYLHYSRNLNKYLSYSELRTILKGWGVDGFLIINRSLKKKLISKGIEAEKIFYLPNGIDPSIFRKTLSEKEKSLIRKRLKIPEKSRILLYPVRVVMRKNIEEAILFTYFIKELTKKDYILLVAGKIDKRDPLSRKYYQKLKKLIKIIKMPVIFSEKGFPLEKQSRLSLKRFKVFSIGDLYQICSAVLMTSLEEGFGYPYLECWFSNRIVLGRRIETVLADFKKSGLKFNWLYDNFQVFTKERNLLDLNEEERFKRIDRISESFKKEEFRKKLLKINKKILFEQINFLENQKKQKKIIKANLKKAQKIYNISQIAKKFLNLIFFNDKK